MKPTECGLEAVKDKRFIGGLLSATVDHLVRGNPMDYIEEMLRGHVAIYLVAVPTKDGARYVPGWLGPDQEKFEAEQKDIIDPIVEKIKADAFATVKEMGL